MYVFDDGDYTGYEGITDASGEVSFILPEGDYRFRADTGGTQFWSGAVDHCTLPGCETASVTVMIPVIVTVASQNGDPYPDLNVYVFDGEDYTGYNGVSDASGEVVFTLPEGDYRFRADYDGVQFWSDEVNHCTLPGCTEATVEIPGGLGTTEVTIDYTYDPLYRLTAADYDDGAFFNYTYDAVGNRLTQDTLAGTNTYGYDIANRLMSVDGVTYTWDNNGNLLSDGTSTYDYNYANMLAGVNQGGVVYEYLYSGLGDRLQQAIDGVPTYYTLDINTGLTQVLADGTSTYLYGHGRIAQEGAMVEYFLGDALSSVRQLVDGTLVVTLTQSYEPFGDVLISEGEGESVFQFTGEQQNNITNLVYLRSRYYTVGDGRLTSKDVWNGNNTTPMSYNEWLYGYNNPVTYTDPDGKQPINDGNGEELTKEEIKKLFDENPHEVLELLQQQFKIQLPDGYYFRITTGWDIHRWNYSTIYGVEWWFAEYGNLVGTIYEHSDIQCSVFTTSIPSQAKHIDYSVYITKHAISDWKYYPDDIAAIMIHEAVHAWQENVTRGYVVNPGQENDPSSAEWHGKYGNGMERQAVDYVFAANNSDRIDASPRMIWRSLTFRVGRSFGKDFPYTLPPGVP